MTENEAKSKLDSLHYKIIHTSFCNKVYESEIEALCLAKDVLQEIQQYRAIGTIEELQELKEKSVAKKVNIEQWIDTKCSCGYVFSKHHGDGYHSIPYENKTEHCPRCGQKLDWQ